MEGFPHTAYRSSSNPTHLLTFPHLSLFFRLLIFLSNSLFIHSSICVILIPLLIFVSIFCYMLDVNVEDMVSIILMYYTSNVSIFFVMIKYCCLDNNSVLCLATLFYTVTMLLWWVLLCLACTNQLLLCDVLMSVFLAYNTILCFIKLFCVITLYCCSISYVSVLYCNELVVYMS